MVRINAAFFYNIYLDLNLLDPNSPQIDILFSLKQTSYAS